MLKVLKCYSAILISSFFFNQASSKQNLERSSSSEDEDENVTSNQKVCTDHYCVLKRQHNAGNSYCTACMHIFCKCSVLSMPALPRETEEEAGEDDRPAG